MTESGKRLLAAAHEALDFASGRADRSAYVVHAPPITIDVQVIEDAKPKVRTSAPKSDASED